MYCGCVPQCETAWEEHAGDCVASREGSKACKLVSFASECQGSSQAGCTSLAIPLIPTGFVGAHVRVMTRGAHANFCAPDTLDSIVLCGSLF